MNPGQAGNFLGCSQDIFHRNADGEQGNAPFCTRDNWQSAVIYLSQELELLGLPSPCSNEYGEGGQGSSLDVVALVNTCSKLISNVRACTKSTVDLESRLQRLHADLDRAEETSRRQKEAAEAGRRAAFEATERERQAGSRLQEERDRGKQAKDEIRRLNGALSQKDSQYGHELKRRDQELFKLRERMVKILSADRKTSSKTIKTMQGSMEVTALLAQPEGQPRGKWRRRRDSSGQGSGIDPSLAEKLLEEASSRAEVLRGENIRLRDLLISHLQQTMQILGDNDHVEQQMCDTELGAEEIDERLRMPLDFTPEGPEDICDRVTDMIRKRLNTGDDKKSSTCESVAFKVHEQNLARLEAISGGSEDDNPTMTPTAVIAELKKMFRDGRELLRLNNGLVEVEKERLASDRKQMEIERADLDKCKEDFLLRSVDSTRDVRGDDDDEGPDEHVVGATGFTEGGPMWIRQPLSPENCTVTIVGGGGGRHRPRTHSPAAAVTFHVGPVYGSGQGGGSSGSRPPSLPGSTPGSRSHSAVRGEKARSPPPLTAVAASPSSYVKRRERLTSPSGIGGGRPRSAHISPQRISLLSEVRRSPLPAAATRMMGKLRSGSVSPTNAAGGCRSLPRMAAMRKLSLKSPMHSGAEDSDSARDSSAVKKRPPRRGESFVPLPTAVIRSDSVEAKEGELSTQLDRLAMYLNYKEQLDIKDTPTSDSEIEEHLDAIRKALPAKKKEG